jgi:hypothetical protein
LELESGELVVSGNGNTYAVLPQPSLYPRQAELHTSVPTVLTLPTPNWFPAVVLDQKIASKMAGSGFAADSRDAIRAISLAIEHHDW